MKRRIVLAASLVAGVVAALLTRLWLSAREAEMQRFRNKYLREYGEMEALCFTRDIASGSVVSAQDLGTCKTVAKGNRGVVLTKDNIHDITGRKTVGYHQKNEPLRWNDIEGGNSRDGLSNDIQHHFRAMSINVAGSAAVSGMVRAGDWVDVIGTFDFPDDEGKIKRGDPVTCTVLQKVLVLAVGSETAKSRSAGLGLSREASGHSTVTLSVTPREAEMLAFAEHVKGRLTLTLRSRTDIETEDELPIVDFSRIRGQIEELNKERNPSGRRKGHGGPK